MLYEFECIECKRKFKVTRVVYKNYEKYDMKIHCPFCGSTRVKKL